MKNKAKKTKTSIIINRKVISREEFLKFYAWYRYDFVKNRAQKSEEKSDE